MLPLYGLTMRIAWLVPCHNEESTIGEIVSQIRLSMPEAEVWVCDNHSSDRTSERARMAGAKVVHESRLGKGRAVKTLLEAAQGADVFVLIDGDRTYDVGAGRRLVEPILNGQSDMVIASRRYLSFPIKTLMNRIGSYFFSWLFTRFFAFPVSDVLSGYRAFNGRIHEITVDGNGFEFEIDLTAKFVLSGLNVSEIRADYGDRPTGSTSKLRRLKDGSLILIHIFRLWISGRELRPAMELNGNSQP